MRNKLLLTVFAFTAINFAFAQYNSESDFAFWVMGNNEGIRITGVGWEVEDLEVNIPPQIQGLPVVEIWRDAFFGRLMTSITIPYGVTYIGGSAFADNILTSFVIPNSVTYIGDRAFERNELTSITIPNNVSTIRVGAFQSNRLTNITIPNGVTRIEASAFRSNQLTGVVIPDSVTYIGLSAFANNQLTSITIGANVMLQTQQGMFGPFGYGFEAFYNNPVGNNRQAGTFTRPNAESNVWTRQ